MLAFGFGTICGVLMSLAVETRDRDYSGSWNYLLLSKNTPEIICGGDGLAVSGEVHLSFSQVKDALPFKEGESFDAAVVADCHAGAGIDETVKDGWAAYRVWTCTVTSLEVK